MTPYATQEDIVDLEGEDALYVAADRNRDDLVDTAAVARAIEAATGEMNSYIGQRYDLPLSVTPPWAKQICVDITLYRLSRTADRLTNELRRRYEDAIAFLKHVGTGKAGLGVATVAAPPVSGVDEIKGGVVLVTSEPRQFSRSRLKGL